MDDLNIVNPVRFCEGTMFTSCIAYNQLGLNQCVAHLNGRRP